MIFPGILTLQPTNQPQTKAAGLERHRTVIFTVGLPAITLGTSAIVYNKYLHGYEHYKTWHAVSTDIFFSSSGRARTRIKIETGPGLYDMDNGSIICWCREHLE